MRGPKAMTVGYGRPFVSTRASLCLVFVAPGRKGAISQVGDLT